LSRPKNRSASPSPYGLESLPRAVRRRRRQRRGAQQRRVLAQDRLLEGHDVVAGIDPELTREHGLELMDGAQGLSLGARLVLGQREQRPAAFPKRSRPHQGLSLGQHLVVAAGAQMGVHPKLLRLQPQLPEPPGLVGRRGPRPHVGEGLATPQRQRLGQQVRRAIGLAQGQQLPATNHQALELHRVDLVRRQGQGIPLRGGLDGLRAHHLPQPGDAPLQDLARGRRWCVAPEGIRDPIRRDRVTRTRRQHGEDYAVAGAEARRAVPSQRAENGDAHLPTIDLGSRAVNTAGTELLPRRHRFGADLAPPPARPGGDTRHPASSPQGVLP
jgi:hypothetical protein